MTDDPVLRIGQDPNNLTNYLLDNNYSLNTTNLNIQSNDTSPRPE